MQKQLDTLRRIQDLSLMRAECVARGAKEKVATIDQEVTVLVEMLEPRIRALYSRLSATKPLFMAAMHNGICSGCGMQVPDAAARMVKIAAHLVTCTTCGRILYDNAGALASARQKVSMDADEVPKERGIARFSAEALMVPNLKAKTAQAAIEELAHVMAENGFVSNGDELVRLALEREAVLSTRMDEGAAVPHVRGVEGGSLAFALGVSPAGLVWDDSGEKVNFVVLSAIPSAGSAFFLKLMSDLMGAFRRKPSRTALLQATDPAMLWKALERATCRIIR